MEGLGQKRLGVGLTLWLLVVLGFTHNAPIVLS